MDQFPTDLKLTLADTKTNLFSLDSLLQNQKIELKLYLNIKNENKFTH